MREIDHVAAMAMMGILANPMTNKVQRSSVIINAFELAEQFMEYTKRKQDEETAKLKKENDELMRKHNP